MSLSDISSRTAILDAIEECDQLGRDHFLKKYGYGRAIDYFLEYEGRFYDSKAIVGVAHGYEYPDKGPLRSGEFSGGNLTVKPKLEQLGFRVCVGHDDVPMGVTRPYRRICRQFWMAATQRVEGGGICCTPSLLRSPSITFAPSFSFKEIFIGYSSTLNQQTRISSAIRIGSTSYCSALVSRSRQTARQYSRRMATQGLASGI